MASGGWETVNSKKSKPTSNNKIPRKTVSENLPRVEPAAPVKESPTIYQAFQDAETRRERKLLLEAEKENNNKGDIKKQSPALKRRERAQSLKQCLEKLSLEEYETSFKKSQSMFPKNQEIWLKDIVSLLNSQLDHLPDLDPVIARERFGYPLNEMPETMKNFFKEKISSSNKELTFFLLKHCIESLENNISKGLSSYGYRLFIQMILQSKPELIISNNNNLNELDTMLHQNASRPIRALAILWGVGQVGLHSLDAGVKVWFGLMFSKINVRNLNEYVIQYLEMLFQFYNVCEENLKSTGRKKQSEQSNCISESDYFKFLGQLYSESSTLSGDLKRRLSNLYPVIKKLAWGDESKNLCNFFTGYLSRCTNDCQGSKKTELLDCLVSCLHFNNQSFACWKKDYPKYIEQSSILLKYISEGGHHLKLKKKLLDDAIKSFQATNKGMLQKPSQSSSSSSSSLGPTNNFTYLESSAAICDMLSAKKRGSFSSIWRYLFVTVLFGSLFLLYDVYHHGSLEASKTYILLKNSGVLAMVDQIANHSKHYYQKISKWLVENSPNQLKKLHEYISPYVDSMHKQLCTLVTLILNGTSQYRQWIVLKINDALEQIAHYTPFLLEHLGLLCEKIVHLTSVVLTNAWVALVSTWDYLMNNVFIGKMSPENMRRVALDTIELVQNYTVSCLSWIKETAFKQ